jgi:hypothetical protein
LQAFDVPATRSNAAGRESDYTTACLTPAAAVVDDHRVAKVDEDRDGRVGDYPNVDQIRGATAESGHADTR